MFASQLATTDVKAAQGSVVLAQAAAHLLLGNLDDAARLAEQVLALARERGERGHEGWALRLLGEIACRREPPDHGKSEEQYQAALGIAEALGMRPLKAQCELGLGRCWRSAGKPAEARERLAAAVALLREMDMQLWLEQAEAEVRALG
jgi:tetratricopeptide (TPR) repeat protein